MANVSDKAIALIIDGELKQVLHTTNSFAEILLNNSLTMLDVTSINAESQLVIGSIYNESDGSFVYVEDPNTFPQTDNS